MKSLAKIALLLFVLATLFSCASLNAPVAATSNELGPLVGQSTGIIWFGVIGDVDAGIQKACQDGKILHISTVDFERKMVFFGWGMRYTCTVTGK